jgi:acyl-coenzyme A thioesterase PaaI-like protein
MTDASDQPRIDRLGELAGLVNEQDSTAARRAGRAARSVIERLVATSAPAEVMDAAAVELAKIAATLDGYPRGRSYAFAESSVAGGEMSGDPSGFFDNSPVAGLSNPLAPPLFLRIEEGEVRGDIRWGSQYEGPPGCVHGGYVAASFDEVLGLAQDLGGQPGMTGTLTIRYRRPTPLHADHHFVGTFDGREGRKNFTSGRLYDADENLLAEADGIFISVDLGKMRVLADERERQNEVPPSA